MKNWYPVSLFTAAPRGDGTQSRNQSNMSNEPPPGDSLLFKSDLMPLLSPILPRDPKGGGFNWLVHKWLCLESVQRSWKSYYQNQQQHRLAPNSTQRRHFVVIFMPVFRSHNRLKPASCMTQPSQDRNANNGYTGILGQECTGSSCPREFDPVDRKQKWPRIGKRLIM